MAGKKGFTLDQVAEDLMPKKPHKLPPSNGKFVKLKVHEQMLAASFIKYLSDTEVLHAIKINKDNCMGRVLLVDAYLSILGDTEHGTQLRTLLHDPNQSTLQIAVYGALAVTHQLGSEYGQIDLGKPADTRTYSTESINRFISYLDDRLNGGKLFHLEVKLNEAEKGWKENSDAYQAEKKKFEDERKKRQTQEKIAKRAKDSEKTYEGLTTTYGNFTQARQTAYRSVSESNSSSVIMHLNTLQSTATAYKTKSHEELYVCAIAETKNLMDSIGDKMEIISQKKSAIFIKKSTREQLNRDYNTHQRAYNRLKNDLMLRGDGI
tara:strand:+ start:7116 stop:8078 length:963 start_codon:yes stop_codon:yes gene_type:complete